MSSRRDPRWEQWGAELRRLRELAGKMQGELGRSAHLGKSTISAFERGTRSPRRDHVEALDTALSTGGVLIRLWQDVTNQRYVPDWFKSALHIERRASGAKEYESNVLPGLLQTPAYARTLIREAQRSASQEEIDKATRARTGRLSLLDGFPLLWFVLRESALTELVGDETIMREQLRHIVKLVEERGIGLQILRSEARTSIGTCLPFRVFTLNGTQQFVAYVEDAVGGRVIDDRTTVNELLDLFGQLQAESLSPSDSLTLIRTINGDRYGDVEKE